MKISKELQQQLTERWHAKRLNEDQEIQAVLDYLSQTPRSNPKFNPITPTIPLAPTTHVTHVKDDDEEVFYDCN
jgi:hypothetical protein